MTSVKRIGTWDEILVNVGKMRWIL